MASAPTSRLRLIKQGTYDNPETWGIELNNGMIDMVDEAFGGSSFAVAGNVQLTVENYTEDQARSLFLIMSGAGGFTVTVPAVDKAYLLVNNCAADVTVTPLSGTGAVVRAGTAVWWYCDGVNGHVVDLRLDQIKAPTASVAMNGQKITGLGAGTNPTDAASLSNRLDQFVAPTGSVAMGGQKLTGLAAGVDATDAANVGQIAPFAASAAASAGAAAASAFDANGSAVAAAMLYDMFDDRYLGSKASDPTLDNDGNALLVGALYWNTAGNLRVYSGSNWVPITTLTLASQAEAEAGTDNTKAMTSLRTAQQITAKTGLTANKLVALDGSAKLPAVDGSQLTGMVTPVYTGSDANNTVFPIGTVIWSGNGNTIARNGSQAVYLHSGGFSFTDNGTTALAGTWRSRGDYSVTGTGNKLMQRVA